MKEYVLAISEPTFLLCVGAIWVIIFLTIWKVLKQTLFKGNTAVIVALCVSLLSVISLSQLIAGGGGIQEVNNNEDRTGGILEFILIPYAALAVAILLLLLLRFIARLFRSEEVKRYSQETEHSQTEKRYPLNSSSEACKKIHEKSHIRK